MSRLNRYIIRRWLLTFFPALVVLMAAYLASDASFTVWDYIRRGIAPAAIALHFALMIPNILYEMSPIACLLATLLTLTGLKRTGEMTAMFATGIGGIRMSAPILAAAIGVSIGSFYLTESLAPGANRVSRDIVSKKKGPGASVVGDRRIWLLEGNRVIHISAVQERGTVLVEPTVLQFEGNGLRQLNLRMDSELARWENGSWIAEKMVSRRFINGHVTDTRTLIDQRIPVHITPEEFYQVRRRPEEMGLAQLADYIENLKAAGLPHITYQVSLYQKLSAAVISLIFTVIALPVSFAVPVRGGVPLGTGLSIMLALVYWTLFSLSLSLGHAGVISPPVAAWSAQVLFLVLGLAALALLRHPRLH
ncbi:MAG: LptF/LptG family permease [bacterium]|nr:LptF/LptG family permease [bacterium]MDT8394900.1 LptF/LptG family permease [bacterium]